MPLSPGPPRYHRALYLLFLKGSIEIVPLVTREKFDFFLKMCQVYFESLCTFVTAPGSMSLEQCDDK